MNKQVNRFMVFRAAQAYMSRHHRAPTGAELEAATGLSRPTCVTHMRALDGADGLRFRFEFTKGQRRGEGMTKPRRILSARDPWTSPVDRLMAS